MENFQSMTQTGTTQSSASPPTQPPSPFEEAGEGALEKMNPETGNVEGDEGSAYVEDVTTQSTEDE